MIKSWCSLYSLLYFGIFVAFTVPIIYDKYDDKFDGFVQKEKHGNEEEVQANFMKSKGNQQDN